MKKTAIRCMLLAFALCPAWAPATTYTVGSNGMYATIQGALNNALANPGDDVIKVRTGTYAEGLSVPSLTGDYITISGGWNDSYSAQEPDGGADTRIRPPPGVRGITATISGGYLGLSDLNIGFATVADTSGGGIDVHLSAGGQMTIAYCTIVGNQITSPATTWGAGMAGSVIGGASLSIHDSLFLFNTATGAGAGALTVGGGLSLLCDDNASCSVQNNHFSANKVESPGNAVAGAGAHIAVSGHAIVNVRYDSYDGQQAGAADNVSGLAANFRALESGKLYIDHERFLGGGSAPAVALSEVYGYTDGFGVLLLSDSLVAHSLGDALDFKSFTSSAIGIYSVTAADNAGPANAGRFGSSTFAVANSLFFNPAAAQHAQIAGTTATTNLIGVNPGFLAPQSSDYSLRRRGSPAMNVGTDALAQDVLDLAGAARVQAVIDIGAYESSDRVFADRFDP